MTSAKCMWNLNLWGWRVDAIWPVYVLEMRSVHVEDLFLWITLPILSTELSSSWRVLRPQYIYSPKTGRDILLLSSLGWFYLMVGFGPSEHASVQICVVMCRYFFKKNQNQTTQKAKETSHGIIVYPVDSSHPSWTLICLQRISTFESSGFLGSHVLEMNVHFSTNLFSNSMYNHSQTTTGWDFYNHSAF